MNNILQFKERVDTMKIEKDICGTEYLYIKGVVSKGVMHRANITPELKAQIKDLIINRINNDNTIPRKPH